MRSLAMKPNEDVFRVVATDEYGIPRRKQMSDSHAVMAEEIVRLREKNKKLCEALEYLKMRTKAGSISINEHVKYVDEKLAECKED